MIWLSISRKHYTSNSKDKFWIGNFIKFRLFVCFRHILTFNVLKFNVKYWFLVLNLVILFCTYFLLVHFYCNFVLYFCIDSWWGLTVNRNILNVNILLVFLKLLSLRLFKFLPDWDVVSLVILRTTGLRHWTVGPVEA